MKKILILLSILMCLILVDIEIIEAGDLELWRLREMFKAKLNPDPNYFPDEVIDQINMKSAQIASIHAFCCSRIDTIVLDSAQVEYALSKNSLWNYAMKPLMEAKSDERAWQSINIQDVGKGWTGDVPIPNFFYNWTDDIVCVDPRPTATDSILLYYFAYSPVSASVIDEPAIFVERCRAVDVDGNDNIYVGFHPYSGNTRRIYKSADSGATWDTVWCGEGEDFNTIFVASNNYVYAGQAYTQHVIRSTDGGVSWDTCLSFLNDSSYFWQMAEDTLGNLFIGEYSITDTSLHRATVWKSTDNGATWDTSYYNPDRLQIHITAVDPHTNYVYATVDVAAGISTDSTVFIRSTDIGVTWDTIASGDYGKFTALAFSSNYRILGDDFTAGDNSDIFITSDDSTFTSTYTYPHAWCRVIRQIGDTYYAGFFLTNAGTANLHLLESHDEGQHWSVAKNYNVGFPAHIMHIAQRPVDGWIYYAVLSPDWPQGRLRKFKPAIQVQDLDNKCREVVLTLSTMQYWIREKRTDKAVEYWNLASQEMQILRQGFLQKAYDIMVSSKPRRH